MNRKANGIRSAPSRTTVTIRSNVGDTLQTVVGRQEVGVEGGSYLGHVQWQAALKAPPHLVAIFPLLASTNIYRDTVTFNGGFRLSLAFGWGPVRQESRMACRTPAYTRTESRK